MEVSYYDRLPVLQLGLIHGTDVSWEAHGTLSCGFEVPFVASVDVPYHLPLERCPRLEGVLQWVEHMDGVSSDWHSFEVREWQVSSAGLEMEPS